MRPAGWLLRQLELMADGMVGHLGELSKFLVADNGWFGGSNEGWEEQPYWLRGFYPLGVLVDDRRISAEANRWIEAVISSVDSDGYFGASYHKSVSGKSGRSLPDLWPHMVMFDALIQHWEHTGDERIPEMAMDFFTWCRDLPDERFIQRLAGNLWEDWREDFGDWKIGIQVKRAGDMIPHIYWLYNLTGESWLLELAERFYSSILPPMGEWLDDHIVNFTQRFAYPAIFGQQSGLRAGLAACEYWYNQHMITWGQQPRGIFAADERIRPGKVDPRQAFETCGMVEFAKQFYQLGRMTGDPVYADRTEDVMLNHFPASQTPDLKGLHYLTASNQPQLDSGEEHDYYNKRRQASYSPHDYRCCQHNVAMGWPWYVENLWQATPDRGLATWMYGASEVTAKVGDGQTEVILRQETDYPFRSDVTVTVASMVEETFPLYLRVPRWCRNMSVSVNGQKPHGIEAPGSFVLLDRLWKRGDKVEIQMPPEVSLTRWPRNGSVTVDRGPLSYSVRIDERWQNCGGNDEWPELEVFPKSPWAFAPVLKGESLPEVEVTEHPVPSQPWTLQEAPVEIELPAKRISEWQLDATGTVGEVPFDPDPGRQPIETIRMIPLGCARLRIACLPPLIES